ncbi:MAG: hypothetical protein WD232_08885 [Acidimicrobiales bacterium]
MALVSPVLWEPSADEARVRRAAALWRATPGQLECTLSDLRGTAALVVQEHDGEGIDAFACWWDGLAGPGGSHLADVVKACRSTADALDAYADALADVRRELLEIAAAIAATVAVGAALAWATAGASAAPAAATVTALTVQATALGATFASRAGAIAKLVSLHATIGALEGIATYAVVEPLRVAAFHPNEDPFGSYHPGEVAAAAVGGAVIPGWRAARDIRKLPASPAPLPAAPPPPLQAARARLLPWQKSWGITGRLRGHFRRHGPDFDSATPDAYADEAAEFLERGLADGLPLKVDEHGVIRLYDPATNTFGAYNPTGTTRTFFKPRKPEVYWQQQPGGPR